MKVLHTILLHLGNALAIAMITFYILDYYNPFLKVIDNQIVKTLLIVFSVAVLVGNQLSIWRFRPWNKEKDKGRESRGQEGNK